jgi:CDGSH-type Zn-finger protein
MPASSSEKNSHQSNNKPSCEGTVTQEKNSQQSNNKPSCEGTVTQGKNSQQSNNKPSCEGTVTQVSDVERIALNLFSSVIRLLNETPDTNVIRSLVDKYDNLQAQQEHHQPVSVIAPVPQPDPDSLVPNSRPCFQHVDGELHREGLTGLKTGHDSNTNYSTPKPHKYAIGTKVKKKWGKNNFIGEVVTRGDNGKENTYMIVYEDADKECVREKELDDIIMHPRHSV